MRRARRCAVCGQLWDLQVDHIRPRALGGVDTSSNLQVLCGECNRLKGASSCSNRQLRELWKFRHKRRRHNYISRSKELGGKR